jgi:pilus assembly protein CpaF
MGTIHANSARDAILKLQTLPLLAGANISHSFIVPTVASAIDIVIQISINTAGKRCVIEAVLLTGRHENLQIEMETLWKFEDNQYNAGIGLATLRNRLAAANV